MLKELRGEHFVGRILFGEFERDAHEVQTEHAHPSGRVGLFELRAVRQFVAAVEHGDVVESEEAALEDVVAFAVNLVDPPREVYEQLVETLFEEQAVGLAVGDAIHVVDAPHSPGVDGRVEIGEFPLVSRNLPVRVLKLFEEEQPQLLFRKLRINQGERHAVEG